MQKRGSPKQKNELRSKMTFFSRVFLAENPPKLIYLLWQPTISHFSTYFFTLPDNFYFLTLGIWAIFHIDALFGWEFQKVQYLEDCCCWTRPFLHFCQIHLNKKMIQIVKQINFLGFLLPNTSRSPLYTTVISRIGSFLFNCLLWNLFFRLLGFGGFHLFLNNELDE